MYSSRRSRDLVRKVEYSSQVVYNPPVACLRGHIVCSCDHSFVFHAKANNAVLSDTADISSVQNKHDLGAWDKQSTFPIQSCDKAVIDSLLCKLVAALHIKYYDIKEQDLRSCSNIHDPRDAFLHKPFYKLRCVVICFVCFVITRCRHW